MICSSSSIRISFVLMLYDEFTNTLLDDKMVKIKADMDQKIVRKNKGCIVFLECGKKKMEVEIESPYYLTKTIFVELNKLQGNPPIVNVRMLKSSSYLLSSNITCIAGKAKKGSLIYAYCEIQQENLKLFKNYKAEEDGEVITLYQSNITNIEGKIFLIENKEERQREFCHIENLIGGKENSYKLENPLNYNYKKIGTFFYPVFIGMSDNEGHYIVPIKELDVPECQCICEMIQEEKTEKNQKIILLKNGCINQLDW